MWVGEIMYGLLSSWACHVMQGWQQFWTINTKGSQSLGMRKKYSFLNWALLSSLFKVEQNHNHLKVPKTLTTCIGLSKFCIKREANNLFI